jgi:hypothetical protein
LASIQNINRQELKILKGQNMNFNT